MTRGLVFYRQRRSSCCSPRWLAEVDAVQAAAQAQLDALDAANSAHALCIECGRALIEVNEADPMTVHPCIFECIEAVGDAAEAVERVRSYVERVEQ
jgi:hypothetical protein